MIKRMAWLALGAAVMLDGSALAHANAPALRSSALQVDGDGFVFVVNPDSDSVTRLTPLSSGAQTKQWEAPVGDYPRTLTVMGNFVYTADQGDDTVSKLAKGDGALAGSYSLPAGCAPYGITGNQNLDRLYVTCEGRGELVVLAPDLTLIATVKLAWPTPRAVLVSGDDTRVYVSHFMTVEPNHDARVSEIDASTNQLTERGELVIPLDRTTCETQNSGQGVFNGLNALAMTPPGSPAEVANQLWVGGILQNHLLKGLFRRHAAFADRPELALFNLPCPDDPNVSCMFDSFPRAQRNVAGSKTRNVFKSSFHDIIRSAIWKIDLGTGAIVGKIDIDEGSQATDIVFSNDGTTAYVIDQMFHSYHVFNTKRGQDGNPGTLFAGPSKFGPFGIEPDKGCISDALGSIGPESPHRLPPQVQMVTISSGDPIRATKAMPSVGTKVETGVDFDTRAYHESGVAQMRDVPDGVGSAPIGIGLSPDGCIAYVANYLSRNVVAVAAKSGAGCDEYDPIVGFRCSGDITVSCETNNDCSGGTGFCNHPGGPACTQDSDCVNEPCIRSNNCIPLVGSTVPARTTDLVSEEVPAEILDGKILFNTAARDSSVSNGVGLGAAAPLFNDRRRGCGYDIAKECRSDLNCSFCADQDPLSSPPTCTSNADCGGQRCVLADKYCSNDPSLDCDFDTDCNGGECVSASCDQIASLPGEVVSTAHDASYVTCTTCHLDYGGQDGRTWDFSQFGASLRNTMDLRGRSQAAPGTCGPQAADGARIGSTCHFDAECGTGSGPGACVADSSMIPPHLTGPDRSRYFNPMVSVHWNGDRMEVEAFEFTYRQLLAAGDCDGAEHDPEKCLGALIPRSLQISTATVPFAAGFEGDLQSTLRNILVEEPTLAKAVNASVRLTHMADFTYSLTRFPKNPNLGDDGASPSEAAERGRLLFNDESTGCASCHNGPGAGRQLFTDKRPNPSFVANQPPGAASNNPYVRHAVGTENLFDATDPDAVADEDGARQNGVIPIPASRGALAEYVTPVLNDAWNTAPFLHDGSAPTLLDVVRPCTTTSTDCNQPGLGRNVDEKHGKTAQLTPQQLNDLVAFQKAPHGPVGSTGSAIKAGALTIAKMALNFGKKAGKGSFTVTGTAAPGALPVDPGTGGLTFTLAVPGGDQMAMLEVVADAASVKVAGDGKRISYKAKAPAPGIGSISVSLKQQSGGSYKVVVKGKKVDASTLRNGARDVTAALTVGTTQFVQNRVLTAKKSGRLLALAK